MSTDETQKQEYLRLYKEREGIELDPQMVRKNPGRKATAKLMLNSFWGKFVECVIGTGNAPYFERTKIR